DSADAMERASSAAKSSSTHPSGQGRPEAYSRASDSGRAALKPEPMIATEPTNIPTRPSKPLWMRWQVLLPAILVIAGAAIGGFFYPRRPSAPQLTDKDQLILADFNNQTGDPVFDSTLKEALAIQLEQSPLIQLVSDAELHNNLQYLGQPKEQKITPELAQQ